MGAIAVAQQAGYPNCISIDVGGTSADVCLAQNAQPTVTMDGEIADLPLAFPILDVHSIGVAEAALHA